MDSRSYGMIPFEFIDKRVYYICWSRVKSRIGEQIGK